jgi:SAM-dependent methyltransferase
MTIEGRPCVACGARSYRRDRLLPDLVIHTCRCCGLILSSIARRADVVPEFALVDEAAYVRAVGLVRRRQAREILSVLRRHVTRGRLLDVGCSFGFFLLEARREGFEVAGIEPDPLAFERASEVLGPADVRLGLFSRETADAKSADTISTLDVLEHIEPAELDGFAELVGETLRSSGLWVIKVPSTEGLYYRLSHLLRRFWPRLGARFIERLWQTRYEYPHLVYFDLRTLSLWLGRHDFEIVEHRFVQEVPTGTVVDRLTTDGGIGRAGAYLLAPVIVVVNVIERFRRRSDSLVVLARRRRM